MSTHALALVCRARLLPAQLGWVLQSSAATWDGVVRAWALCLQPPRPTYIPAARGVCLLAIAVLRPSLRLFDAVPAAPTWGTSVSSHY